MTELEIRDAKIEINRFKDAFGAIITNRGGHLVGIISTNEYDKRLTDDWDICICVSYTFDLSFNYPFKYHIDLTFCSALKLFKITFVPHLDHINQGEEYPVLHRHYQPSIGYARMFEYEHITEMQTMIETTLKDMETEY